MNTEAHGVDAGLVEEGGEEAVEAVQNHAPACQGAEGLGESQAEHDHTSAQLLARSGKG